MLEEFLFQVEVNKIADNSNNMFELLGKEKELMEQISSSLNIHLVTQLSRYKAGDSLREEIVEIHNQINSTNVNKKIAENYLINKAELALILAGQGLYDDANNLLPQLDAPFPKDLQVLYAMAKISDKAGNPQRASEAALRLLDLLENKQSINTISVWGDHLSQVNLGMLLLDLHMPEKAANIFNHALKICPNDPSLLSLLADSYKLCHQDEAVAETYRTLVSLKPDNLRLSARIFKFFRTYWRMGKKSE